MSFAAKNWYAEYTLIIQKTGLNTIALNPYKNNFLFFALEQSIFFNSPGFITPVQNVKILLSIRLSTSSKEDTTQ